MRENVKAMFYAIVCSLMMSRWVSKHIGAGFFYNIVVILIKLCAFVGLSRINWIIMLWMKNVKLRRCTNLFSANFSLWRSDLCSLSLALQRRRVVMWICATLSVLRRHIYVSDSIQLPLGQLMALCAFLSGPSDTSIPTDSNEHDSWVNSLRITEMNWCYLLKKLYCSS